ncbi:putative quinol monooxygenase [Kitasatospora sp. NPDC088346]|uniref:putative quinol monooxygenase n=1 Tax=Kitasatospora sp. NPDC088346 TaxID=3364073 RepID=UPI00382C41D1
MILVVVKMTVRPEHSKDWLTLVDEFTTATREEPGNLFFEWSTSVDTPHQFVLVEGFASREAGQTHVESAHFKKAMETMADAIATTPEIISTEAPGDGWSAMAELSPRRP